MKNGRENPITKIWIPDARAVLGAAFAMGYTVSSTKAKVLIGEWIDRPSGGRIFLCGKDISHLSQQELVKNIAACTQDTVLLPATILENLRFGAPEATEDQIRSVCEVLGIHKEIDALPEKYNTLLRDLGEPLSLGQRKRIALARTLLKNAYIYIFDEPSAGLDVQNTLRLKKVFETLSKDRIVMVITHDAVLLDECGNKIRMEGAAEWTGIRTESGKSWKQSNPTPHPMC